MTVNGSFHAQKASRGGRYPNLSYLRSRRFPEIELFKWNSILGQIRAESESAKPTRDRMRLAHHYQAILDSGEVETRAELARYLGVSRARVTQVLNRLAEPNSRTA